MNLKSQFCLYSETEGVCSCQLSQPYLATLLQFCLNFSWEQGALIVEARSNIALSEL